MTLSPHEQRRGTRRLFLGGITVAVLCVAAVLVWAYVYVPPGASVPQQAGGPTGTLTNQGAGQSTAGKNETVAPQPGTGTGQNSSAEAGQIERSAGPLKLSDQQRQQIRSYFASNNKADRLNSADFTLSIGSAVPQQVPLQKLPPEIASAMQGFANDDYVLVGNQLVIVEPNARRVVAVVPDAG